MAKPERTPKDRSYVCTNVRMSKPNKDKTGSIHKANIDELMDKKTVKSKSAKFQFRVGVKG